MYFESHAHYDDEAYDKDRDELLLSLKNYGVDYVIQSAASISSSIAGIELSKKYDFIYCTLGVHPHDVEELNEDNFKELKSLSKEKKVVAIGEIGLDYYYDNAPRDLQKYWFEKQMEWSKEVNLPIVIHSREASQDTFDLVEKVKPIGGLVHCYSGSLEMAKEYIKKGFYIGIGGTSTFKNAKKIIEVIKELPLSAILIETDAPYLSPVPFRGKRNDSSNLKYIVEKIAEIKSMEIEEVASVTKDNGMKLFKI